MRLALIGCGLIGASAAWAMRRAKAVDTVFAYNRHMESALKAVELGIAERASPTIAEAVREADAVLIAVPVKAMKAIFEQVAEVLPPDAYVSDVGSVRGSVVADARAALGEAFCRYAPIHPIAGGEKMGIDAARADLFVGTNAISTPDDGMGDDAVQFWENLWSATGSKIVRMSVEEHDSIFASVSHLPHVLAFGYVDAIARLPDAERRFTFAGPGFKDFTRIAASSSAMWRDICLTNRAQVLAQLDHFTEKIAELRAAIEGGDAEGLDRIFERAASRRRLIINSKRPS